MKTTKPRGGTGGALLIEFGVLGGNPGKLESMKPWPPVRAWWLRDQWLQSLVTECFILRGRQFSTGLTW